MTPFETKTQFVILMHPREARKEKTGTGRLAHAILKNSEIIIDVDFTNNEKVNSLISNTFFFPTLLYPGDTTIDITQSDALFLPNNKKLLIFVIDGTWSCAKKMMKLSKNLHSLQRISFSKSITSKFSIKTQPNSLCLSTIEALFYTIESLNRINLENTTEQNNLLLILDKLVLHQKQCAADERLSGYRKSPFKKENQKKPSKKWEKRKVFF